MLAIIAVTLVLGLTLAACSSTKGIPPIRSEFMDIPLPEGLVYLPDKSAVIESETVRAARLIYSSKFEPGSLVLSIQDGLQGAGWRLVRTTSSRRWGRCSSTRRARRPSRCGSGKAGRSAAPHTWS